METRGFAMWGMSTTGLPDTRTKATTVSAPDDGFYHPGNYAQRMDGLNSGLLNNNADMSSIRTTTTATIAATAIMTTMAQSHLHDIAPIEPPTSKGSLALTANTVNSISGTTMEEPTSTAAVENLQTTSAISATAQLLQHQGARSNNSYLYPLLSVVLVASFMAVMILCWFRKRTRERKAILSTYRHPPDSPSNPSKFSVTQLKGLASSIQNKSTASFDTISSSIRSLTGSSTKSCPGTCPEKGAAAFETERLLKTERYLERKLRQLIVGSRNISAFGRLAAVPIWRHHINSDAHSVNYEYPAGWSAATGSSSRQDSDENSSLDTNSSVSKEIISPPPAVLSAQTYHDEPLGLKRNAVSSAKPMITIETTSVEHCSVSRSSTVSEESETMRPERIDDCPVALHAKAVELFRWNIHRVEMDFKPRNDAQLRVDDGDEVVMTRLFDDGWAFCEHVGSKKKGLVPRAYLSSWPSRRTITPPGPTGVRLVSPNTYTTRPATPISPISSISPRFYSSGSSTESLS